MQICNIKFLENYRGLGLLKTRIKISRFLSSMKHLCILGFRAVTQNENFIWEKNETLLQLKFWEISFYPYFSHLQT
jgi:hypothetical protein